MSHPKPPAPFSLVAEITHRCPLHCVYCSNPLELRRAEEELASDDWLRVLEEAHGLGVVQLHLSGGEPLLRADLEALVERGRKLELYTNLITSGAGLTPQRTRTLAACGLDNVQLSIQASAADLNNWIGGRRSYQEKAEAAEIIRNSGLAFSMNVVLHRLNLDQLEAIIDLCAAWGAERLELANTQYYGWALVNREILLPVKDQVVRAEAVYERKKSELQGRMELIWVRPDYYEAFPKPCMGGWGHVHIIVSPDGSVLPCPAASSIRTLRFENVKDHSLGWIWYESPAFNGFRGLDWMPDPCRSCDRRFQDFGGCRCQAFALTGDAARTDPVCQWAPDHHLVEEAINLAQQRSTGGTQPPGKDTLKQFTYRPDPGRRRYEETGKTVR
jgi:pyrroloquinoline quinone biosynthesis protein E